MIKNLPDSARDVGLIPKSGRSPGEGNGNSLQYPCLGNPMDRGAWPGVIRFEHDLVAKLPPPPSKIIPLAFMKKPGENLRHLIIGSKCSLN